jgi:two-component system, sporulation sensor kinase D
VNLYSNKQKYKVLLLLIALVLVSLSLFVSNSIVTKVRDREKDRATQWAESIKKKIELVKLTDRTFTQLRDKEREKMTLWIEATKEVSKLSALDGNTDFRFPFYIIQGNKNIPVIVVDNEQNITGHINLDFDTSNLRPSYPEISTKELNAAFEDSLLNLSKNWTLENKPFTVEVFEGLFLTYFYSDSKEIVRLEEERDSLIQSFNKDLINNEGLVPVLLYNPQNDSIIGSNIEKKEINVTGIDVLRNKLANRNEPIRIQIGENQKILLYFDSSTELKQLFYFPYIQFFIIGLFILIGYLIFSTFRKAEQNKVWAGMAKETAHQLGTPLSSLMAWVEILDTELPNNEITKEMRQDIQRLEKVSDRFSKIGSKSKLKDMNVGQTVEQILKYLRPRISSNINLRFENHNEASVPHNAPLLEWVIENLIKNAVDAMEAKGEIDVMVRQDHKFVYIDIKDNGKGISPKQLKTVFQPGFSTKTRGWGLGLSLVKRIISEYHKGTVFVLHSELNKGTTFRISLKVAQ